MRKKLRVEGFYIVAYRVFSWGGDDDSKFAGLPGQAPAVPLYDHDDCAQGVGDHAPLDPACLLCQEGEQESEQSGSDDQRQGV